MSTYTVNEVMVLKDERSALTDKLFKHYQSCPMCNDSFMMGLTLAPCPEVHELADEIRSIDECVGYTEETNYEELAHYYKTDTETDVTPYSDLVAEYVTTVSERAGDPWAAYRPDLDPTTWDEVTARREALRAPDGPEGPADPRETEATAVWVENMLMTADVVFDEEATAANFRSLLRVWTTGRGEVAIYKTFISNVTNSHFTAYCAPCKKRLVMERSATNVINTVKHAHSHVPNSQAGFGQTEDGPVIYLDGSNAYALPGNRETDVDYVKRAGIWAVQNERRRGANSNAPVFRLDPTYLAWLIWLREL